jgi:hypothetical protein
VRFEQAPSACSVVGSYGLFELIDEIVRTGRERLDVAFSLGQLEKPYSRAMTSCAPLRVKRDASISRADDPASRR